MGFETKLLLLLVLIAPEAAVAAEKEICVSPTKTFTSKVDLHAGELGYFLFEECGDVLNPTIEILLGETYTFVQKDRTNYFHPLGFAYSPYGDEEIKLEVEPGVTKNPYSNCAETLTCPAPMYFLNDEYLGNYSNIAEVKPVSVNEGDFGLDVYEPLFFRSPHEWTDLGTFSVKLRFDDAGTETDMFYFCHIHEFMGGRLKLTDPETKQLLNPLDSPSLGYEYDQISEFDRMCGTFGLDKFQLPNPVCPESFVCGTEGKSEELQKFGKCIDAMNCHMMNGMTTGVRAESEAGLFILQMIPHHQNAVNMAKGLLKTGSVRCEDLADDDDPDCILEAILYEIVNTQNLQIQAMYDYLDAKRYPETDNCVVMIETKEIKLEDGETIKEVTSTAISTSLLSLVTGVSFVLLVGSLL